MLFRPFYRVMYGCVIRKVCVACIYIRAYIIISTCVRAKEMGVFVSHLRHLYAVASLSLYSAIAAFVPVLLLFRLLLLDEYQSELVALCWNVFIPASNSYLCSIKGVAFA